MIDKIEFYEAKQGLLRPREYRKQRSVTITMEQIKFVTEHHKELTIEEIGKALNIPYHKIHSNMRVMGLVKRRDSRKEKQYLISIYTV